MKMIRISISNAIKIASCLLVMAGGASGTIITGPYLQKVDRDRITVMWETEKPGESWVEYRLPGKEWQKAGSSEETLIHEVEITGLASERQYIYRAVTPPHRSPEATFRTAPPRGKSGFRFGVYGDSRSNCLIHTEVARAMESALGATFVVNTGDIVPTSKSGKKIFRQDFFQPLDGLLRETAIYVARGNHESTNPFFEAYLAHPVEGSGNESFFSFDYGNLHVIVLDTTKDYSEGSEQKNWLKSDLVRACADQDTDWIVACCHYPPYSSGGHGSEMTVRSELSPLFEAHGVDIVFSGHDHSYERIRQQNGVVYIVTGGGGAILYNQTKPMPWTVIHHKVNHFVTVDVTEKTLTLIAHGVALPGKDAVGTIDSVVITREPAWSPTAAAGPDRTVERGGRVVLDGSGSYDGDGDPFIFCWSQVSGPPVKLIDRQAATPSFVATENGACVFQLFCIEESGLESLGDRITITVQETVSGSEADPFEKQDGKADKDDPAGKE